MITETAYRESLSNILIFIENNLKKITTMENYIKIDGKKIALSNETVNEFREKFGEPQKIPCPVKMYVDGLDRTWIPFNENKQILGVRDNVYFVSVTTDRTPTPCTLTPCKREDLEVGDTAFRSDFKTPNFSDISFYCKILPDMEYVYTDGDDSITDDLNFNYWWKVEKI